MAKFYERKNIHEMEGYTPGEQPQSLNVIKLNTNENPYPPCEAVMNALKFISPENLRRYPPPDCPAFRRVAAQYHGVEPNQIILTNGGDELLRLLITTFVEPGQKIGMATPSYSLYPVLAKVNDSEVFEIPLNDDWSVPNDFAKRMNDAQAKLVFLVSPHAPSGYLVPVEQLRNVAQELNGILVVDEAYIDFLDPEIQHPSIQLTELGNVVLLRSFSKGYSLAGLRCGYGIGHANLIMPMLTKTKDSYNMDAVAQIIAQTSLENASEASKTWNKVRQERVRLRSALEELGMWTVESQSNFVLATVPPTFYGGAKSVYLALKDKNIFVRYWDQPKLSDKLRITVGTPEENSALLEALNKLKHESK